MSAGSSDNDGDEISRNELIPEDLSGVWTDAEDQLTLDLHRDSVLLFSSGHFDECESSFDLRAAELEVDLELDCESVSEPGVEYRAVWALELGRAEDEADDEESIGNVSAIGLARVPEGSARPRRTPAARPAGELTGWDQSTGSV